MLGFSNVFRSLPGGDLDETSAEPQSGAVRLVEIAIEVDAWGPTVEAAVSELVDKERVGSLVELVRGAPQGCRAADRVRSYLNDPELLRRILSTEEVDEASVQLLVREMGGKAVGPLLDALTESESRSVRRKVFDSLVGMHEDLSSEVVPRLDDPRWYVVRNMLALILRLDPRPSGFDPMRFLRHADARVRREAFPLAVKDEAGREEAISYGLASDDERVIGLSLQEVQAGAPDALVPSIVSVAGHDDHPPWLRALAVRALRGAASTAVREVLLDVAAPASGLFGRRKLSAEKAPHVVAAVQVLAERWRYDPNVADLLDAARRSGDPDVRRAASAKAPS